LARPERSLCLYYIIIQLYSIVVKHFMYFYFLLDKFAYGVYNKR